MSAALCMMADIDLKAYDTLAQEEGFATEPLMGFTPLFQRADEEEVYISFEEAISDRLPAIHSRLERLSDPALVAQTPRYQYTGRDYMTMPVQTIASTPVVTEPLVEPVGTVKAVEAGATPLWRPSFIYIGMAVLFSLIGFDLMGLLVLFAR